MIIAPGIELIEAEFWNRPLYIPLFLGDSVAVVDTGLVGTVDSYVLPALSRAGRSPDELYLIVNTHAHSDHLGGNRELWEASGRRAKFAAHHRDVSIIEDPQGGGWGLCERYVNLGLIEPDVLRSALQPAGHGTKVDLVLRGGESFELGEELELCILPAPGHTVGNICVYEPNHKVLFQGESVCGRCQCDTAGNLLTVPCYDDLEAYLETLACLAQVDFAWMISSHMSPMNRRDAVPCFSESLDFCVRFDREIQDRIRSSDSLVGTLDLHNSMDCLWGEYPADLTMAIVIDTHLKSLLKRGLVSGSLDDGVLWADAPADELDTLVAAVRVAIGGMG